MHKCHRSTCCAILWLQAHLHLSSFRRDKGQREERDVWVRHRGRPKVHKHNAGLFWLHPGECRTLWAQPVSTALLCYFGCALVQAAVSLTSYYGNMGSGHQL